MSECIEFLCSEDEEQKVGIINGFSFTPCQNYVKIFLENCSRELFYTKWSVCVCMVRGRSHNRLVQNFTGAVE